MITAVALDVGETLVDETRQWGAWADWLGVPRLTFFAALGQVVERREDHRAVFDVVRPGIDVAAEAAARDRAGRGWTLTAEDLYPDALGCLAALHASGRVAVLAGNQPAAAERALRELGAPVDAVAGSASWGVAKPSSAFFARVAQLCGVPPGEIAYVGDRVDNDVVPAVEAGMRAVLVRRGPWATAQARWPEASRADAVVDDLTDLVAVLDRLA